MDQKNKKIIHLNEVESTNNYANELISSDAAEEGTVVLAQHQTRGKGQAGNRWESEPGKNLLMSLIWFPDFLPAGQQFFISKIVSLAITDLLQAEVKKCSIKWPNDIYYEHRKLAGILIENSIKGTNLFSSIIGIGMNVNQTVFHPDAPNPVSLKQVTKMEYSISELLKKLLDSLNYWYNILFEGELTKINETYLKRLYRYNQWNLFSEPGETHFEARINGIGEFGQLQLQLRDSTIREYMFKEVEFVI